MARTKQTTTKKSPFSIVKINLKHLTYEELNDVIAWAMRYRKEKLGEEELRLLKEKESLDLRLKELKELDKKENQF